MPLKRQCDRTLGRLGNCYFLAAVAACASQEQDTIIRDLIVEQGHDVGVYGVKFFMDGRWVTTVIDDYFPCVRAGDGSWQPLFASSKRHTGRNIYGAQGGHLNPLGLFLCTSIPFIWSILSACVTS